MNTLTLAVCWFLGFLLVGCLAVWAYARRLKRSINGYVDASQAQWRADAVGIEHPMAALTRPDTSWMDEP
jgi:hypothetical protein